MKYERTDHSLHESFSFSHTLAEKGSVCLRDKARVLQSNCWPGSLGCSLHLECLLNNVKSSSVTEQA
jgi:hypothetical protein